jgi:hypothetical protein
MKNVMRSLTLGVMAVACGFGFVYATYDYLGATDPHQAVTGPAPAAPAQNAPEAMHYVVNLVSRTEPIEMATVQHPDALAKYQVYATQLTIKDTVWHQLRLGFFPDAASAEKVAELLREDYPLVRIAQVSAKEWSGRSTATLVALVSSDSTAPPKLGTGSVRIQNNKPGKDVARATATMRVALSTSQSARTSAISEADGTLTDCDTLTAHPWDPQKLTDGIYWNKVPAARAVLACRLAVSANPNARNMYQFARALAKSKEFSEAAGWYKKSASEGYVQAQYSLGDAYEFGEGVQVNYILAQNWYKKAADQGYTHAADRLNKLQHASITNTTQQMAAADTQNTTAQ